MDTGYKALFTTANYQIYSLYDGTISVDSEQIFFFSDQNNSGKKALSPKRTSIPVNVFLLVGNSKKILIDTGAGDNFGSSYQSKFLSNLSSLQITPEEITDIYLTHIHNDHSGGLTANGDRIFKHATIHVHENELRYWLSKENLEMARTDILSPNKRSFINAKKALKPYFKTNQIKAFNATSDFPKGFSLIEMFGHTPGHSLFQLSDSENTLIFCADMVHSAELQFNNPELLDGFDIDMDKGIKNRIYFYEMISNKQYFMAGAHLPYPGIGKLIKEKDHYNLDLSID